jgi:hypothetical protein
MEESVKMYLNKQDLDGIQLGQHNRVLSSGRLVYSSNETWSFTKDNHSLKSALLHAV